MTSRSQVPALYIISRSTHTERTRSTSLPLPFLPTFFFLFSMRTSLSVSFLLMSEGLYFFFFFYYTFFFTFFPPFFGTCVCERRVYRIPAQNAFSKSFFLRSRLNHHVKQVWKFLCAGHKLQKGIAGGQLLMHVNFSSI